MHSHNFACYKRKFINIQRLYDMGENYRLIKKRKILTLEDYVDERVQNKRSLGKYSRPISIRRQAIISGISMEKKIVVCRI